MDTKKTMIIVLVIVIMAFMLAQCNSSPSYSSSSHSSKGAGGYDMPNSSDKGFSDYVKRVDPDLYNSMKKNYDTAIGN